MEHLKRLAIALAVLLALGGAGAVLAFALPDIAPTLGAGFPLSFAATILPPFLEPYRGAVVSGRAIYSWAGVLYFYLVTSLSATGEFERTYYKAWSGHGVDCNGPGDKTSEISTKGSFHIVYTSLAPLSIGLLFLVTPFSITCGEEQIDVRGSTVTPLPRAGLTGSLELDELVVELGMNGEGKLLPTTYFNSHGEEEHAKLEASTGLGYVEAIELEEFAVEVPIQEGKMFVIADR